MDKELMLSKGQEVTLPDGETYTVARDIYKGDRVGMDYIDSNGVISSGGLPLESGYGTFRP